MQDVLPLSSFAEGGIAVVDISDPAQPAIVGSHYIGGEASGLDVDGDFLYIAAQELGLTLLDDMNGHPSMAGYRSEGYEIITF